jgi:hypothetical protein
LADQPQESKCVESDIMEKKKKRDGSKSRDDSETWIRGGGMQEKQSNCAR